MLGAETHSKGPRGVLAVAGEGYGRARHCGSGGQAQSALRTKGPRNCFTGLMAIEDGAIVPKRAPPSASAV